MARWLWVGVSIFAAGGVLVLLLAGVYIAEIASPGSWTWSTLIIVAMLLLIVGQLIISVSRAKQREKT